MNIKLKGPTKGALKKLSNRLKELGQRPPPNDLMAILNQTEELRPETEKKVAVSSDRPNELDI